MNDLSDSAMAAAFVRVGIPDGDALLPPWERAVAWAMEAIARYSRRDAEGARLGFLAGKLKADPTWAVLDRLMPGTGRQAVLRLLEAAPDAAKSSPKGAREGQDSGAAKANRVPPSREVSAAAEEGEGQRPSAAKARSALPSPSRGPIGPVRAHLRGHPGTAQPRPIAMVTPREPRAGIEAMRAARQIAAAGILASKRIDGVVLGEATAGMARSWARRMGKEAHAVRRLIDGIPDDMRIGAALSPAEADARWQAAMREVPHAA